MTEKKKLRIYLQMADEMVEFYQKMADEMGIPRSSCMIMALKTYMDQQEMLVFSQNIKLIESGQMKLDIKK